MRRDDTRRTLVCYDIINDKRRTKIASLLGRYGDRVQYSVFVVDIAPARLLRLKDSANEIINQKEDSILFCDLGKVSELSDKRFSYLGQPRETTDNNTLII